MFSVFNFKLGYGDIISKKQTKVTKIVGNDNPIVLWHCMKTIVNLIRHLTSIHFLIGLNKTLRSQQYSVS
jgi:hypothetical protein